MDSITLISIYTQVYNTREYIKQCINSVLTQTYTNFEYTIIDNGSTDGSKELLEQFAAKDRRIKLIRLEKNQTVPIWLSVALETAKGDYIASLDSDDWWEPGYLEKLLAFAEKNQLDIVCTGTIMHIMATGAQSVRKMDHALNFSKEAFAEGLPLYHAFFRPIWGKLVRTKCIKAVPLTAIPNLAYGTDTLWCFQILRNANRIGIDNSVLHHYRIHKSSISYKSYDSKRFESDVYLYNDAIDFLTAYGPVSAQNRNFLQAVYSNAVVDTLGVIRDASLTPADKLREYRTIATHPLTQATYRECTGESAARSRAMLLNLILQTGAALGEKEDIDLRAALQVLLPNCGKAVTGRNLPLFLQDQVLSLYLLEDNADLLVQQLLAYISENRYTKKYNLANVVQVLAADKPLLCQIDNIVFLRKYSGLYLSVWRGEALSALEEMTGMLLEDQVTGGKETFLQLYISLAALEGQVPAFIFGKLQLAWFYLRQGRREECRAAANELAEMGLESEELPELLRALGEDI